MTKREIWNRLDAGWRRTFRKTMRRWMRHVKEQGYWMGVAQAKVQCYLCVKQRLSNKAVCSTCPVAKDRKEAHRGFVCACESIAAYEQWCGRVFAYRHDHSKHKPLREARAVLRYLCGFPPASDKTRQAAEELLARRNQ